MVRSREPKKKVIVGSGDEANQSTGSTQSLVNLNEPDMSP